MPVIMEFSTLCDPGKSVPADASSLVPPVFDQLGPHPRAAPREIPDLLERLPQVPDPRDPRGVRYPHVTVLALTACAVLAGARSLVAVSEWVAAAPTELLERLGTRVDPLFPERDWPAESTIRRLLTRVVGVAQQAVSDLAAGGVDIEVIGLVEQRSLRRCPIKIASFSCSYL
jgi:hypothetical protein